MEDLVEVEVVIADIPALDPSPDLIPAAETLTFSAYVSALSALSFGPSFEVASSLAAARQLHTVMTQGGYYGMLTKKLKFLIMG